MLCSTLLITVVVTKTVITVVIDKINTPFKKESGNVFNNVQILPKLLIVSKLKILSMYFINSESLNLKNDRNLMTDKLKLQVLNDLLYTLKA